MKGEGSAENGSKIRQIFLTQKSRDITSGGATVVVSLILFLLMLFIPVKNKKFNDIRIQLDAPEIEKPKETVKPIEKPKEEVPPVEKKKVEQVKKPVEKKAETKKTEPKPVEKKVAETKPAEKKAAPAKTQAPSTPAPKPTPIQGKKSVDDLMAENNARQKNTSKSAFDDAMFEDDASVSQTSTSKQASRSVPLQKSELSGTAAKSSSSSASSAGGQSGQNSTAKVVGNASTTTTDALDTISKTTKQPLFKPIYSDKTDNVYTYSPEETSRGITKSSPIRLSEGTEKQFERSLRVKITISFDAGGFVTGIDFTPPDTFPRDAMNEIRNQLRQWQFEAGTSAGKCEFYYTVEVFN